MKSLDSITNGINAFIASDGKPKKDDDSTPEYDLVRTTGESTSGPLSIAEPWLNPFNKLGISKSEYEANRDKYDGVMSILDNKEAMNLSTPSDKFISESDVIYTNFSDIDSYNFRYPYFTDGGLPHYSENGSIISGAEGFKNIVDSDRKEELLSDPTIHSFKITIDEVRSPLFAGKSKSLDELLSSTTPINDTSIESFLRKYSGIDEIKGRMEVYYWFRTNFFKFFHSNVNPVKSNSQEYYLKSISGLENLIETSGKQFVDFGKDKITLSFNEDVRQSMGFLMHLYKTLSWSRANGKYAIPNNLLRFDMTIEIKEVRNYNKIAKVLNGTTGNYAIFADNLTTYKYNLYECELKLDKMPHGADIDMTSANKTVDSADMDIIYKYSTLNMVRFDPFTSPDQLDRAHIVNVDNSKFKPVSLGTDNDIANLNKDSYKSYSPGETDPEQLQSNGAAAENNLDQRKDSEKYKKHQKFKDRFDTFKDKVKGAVIQRANQEIAKRLKLVNDAIFKVGSAVGVLGMTPPKNVYNPGDPTLNAIKGAAGQFVKSTLQDFLKSKGLGGK